MNEVSSLHRATSGEEARNSVRALMRLLRPQQWIKNLFLLAPLLFSGRLMERGAQVHALLAFVAFCLLASTVYVVNDIFDREADRAHPTKRMRPLAAGIVTTPAALLLAGATLVAGGVLAVGAGPGVATCGATYLALNALYTWRLKQVVILDVFAIAAFFVLRLLAGASAVEVRPSVWLILCGGLLALYLGFAKRRHELMLLGEDSQSHRSVLSQYTTAFLDQLSVVLLAIIVVAYIMYTLDSETARAVGGERLSYSTGFVLYGVLRYLHLVHTRADADPTDTLLTDRGLLVTVSMWAAYCAYVVYGGRQAPSLP